MNKPLLAMTALLALSMDACPQPWKDKDPTQWTVQDCTRVLTGSPWVHYENIGREIRMDVETPYGIQSITRSVALYSALPVRQAYHCSLAYFQRHTNLGEAASGWPSDQDDDNIVFSFYENIDWYSANNFVVVDNSPRPQVVVHRSALILKDGRIILPIRERSVHQGFIAEFPRYLDGKPIHELSGKNLVIAVGTFSASKASVERKFKFKIADLMYQGKIEY